MSEPTELQELRDREAIRQVFVDYARTLDSGDYEGYIRLYARDGAFGDAVGSEAIRASVEAYARRVEEGKREGRFKPALHIMDNHDIRISGDRATAVILWSYVAVGPDGLPELLQIGRYDDELVREDGVWKLARHRIERLMGRGQLDEAEPTRLELLQQRVRELEDREAIRQIFVDYARYLDSGDFDGYASLFASNGVLVASLGEAVGPSGVRELLGKYRSVAKTRDLPKAVHVMNNEDIVLDGDRATAKVLWFYLTTDADRAPTVLQAGRYTDDLVRENGVWKLARHDISRIMGRAPFDPAPPTRLDAIEERLRRLEEAAAHA